MNPANKRPAYLFAKDFKFENVLGNLQGYKVATGQVEKGEFEALSKKYGSDEGAVFGSLITNAAGQSKSLDTDGTSPPTKRRRRRRRRRRRKQNEDDDDSSANLSTTTVKAYDLQSQEHLVIPASILAYGSSDSDISDDGSKHSEKSNKGSSEEELSSEDDTPGTADFFGLTEEETRGEPSCLLASTGEETVEAITCPRYTCNEDGRQQTEAFSAHVMHKRPEVEKEEWDTEKVKFREKVSEFSSFKCWKCRRIGHLAEDCTVKVGDKPGPSGHNKNQDDDSSSDATTLKGYYKRCQELRHSKHSMCTECGGRSNLACCLECGLILCDGHGHLTDHLMDYPSHIKLYSFKLKKMIKCHKPTCGVVDVTKLLMCATCLGKQFDGHYSMINATWSRSGLRGIPSTLACEQHFHWHRMNCANSSEEPLVTQEKLELAQQRGDGLLSEFYF